MKRIRELGPTPHARFDRALDYSTRHEIDLASAYSVLLGIMTLEDCPALPEEPESARVQSTKDWPPPDEGSRSPRKPTYDRGFRPAVSQGYLTAAQATMKGDRVACASRLASRHGLSMRLAFLVADRQLTLHDALVRKASAEGIAVARTSHTSARRPYRAAALFLGVLCIAAWGVAKMAAGSSESTGQHSGHIERVKLEVDSPTVEPTVTVRSNAQGEVTQVVGRDPYSILHALCDSESSDSPCEPLNVKPAPVAWTAFYRQGKKVHSIAIRKDELAGRWVAGNGVNPIRPSSGS